MAQASNITIKKADGTTDVTYTVQIASGGDKSPAIWQELTAGTAPVDRPTFKVDSAWNGAKTARRVHARMEFPYSVTNPDGTTTVVNRCLYEANAVIPQNVPDTTAAEAVAQTANLLASALIKGSFATGYAPV